MATFTKVPFSASTAGEPILITATSSPGTTVNAQSAGTEIYEVWAWAANQHTSPITINIEWGGTTAQYIFPVTIPAAEGLFQIIPGLSCVGSHTFKVWCTTTGSKINIWGFCNKISVFLLGLLCLGAFA